MTHPSPPPSPSGDRKTRRAHRHAPSSFPLTRLTIATGLVLTTISMRFICSVQQNFLTSCPGMRVRASWSKYNSKYSSNSNNGTSIESFQQDDSATKSKSARTTVFDHDESDESYIGTTAALEHHDTTVNISASSAHDGDAPTEDDKDDDFHDARSDGVISKEQQRDGHGRNDDPSDSSLRDTRDNSDTLSSLPAPARDDKPPSNPKENGLQSNLPADSCKPLSPLKWELKDYRDSQSKQSKQPKQRLLVGMYSGFDDYAKLLDITVLVNKAYAKRWGQSIAVLQGVAMHLGDVDGGYGCTPKAGVRAAFNKIKLLQYALNHTDKFDHLLLVDTDAMIYDLDFDITSMVDDRTMLVAHRVRKDEPERGNWNVNNGVTLWNLHHAETAGVVSDWDRFARKALTASGGVGGDQHQLHNALKVSESRVEAIKATYGEFWYGNGSVVRHFIRNNNNVKQLGWKAPNPLGRRIFRLHKARTQACQGQETLCDSIEYVRYGDGDYDIFGMGVGPSK